MKKNEWEFDDQDFPPGKRVSATIQRVWQLGMRVELDEAKGITGIVRNQEISWAEDISDVTRYLYQGKPLAQGQKIQLSVLYPDFRNRQLVLSLRRAAYDPWDHQGDKYLVGNLVTGMVERLTKTHARIEFDDHITAVLPLDEVVPWKIQSADQILSPKDCIEAIVLSRQDERREIVLSMKARLRKLAEELSPGEADDDLWAAELDEQPLAATGAAGAPARADKAPLQRILIIDNNEDDCLILKSHLNELGYEQIDTETDFKKACLSAVDNSYDLIFMDLKDTDDELAGIHTAECIQAEKPEALIVLVTGEETIPNQLNGARSTLSGMIFKPISIEALEGAMFSLEHVEHAGWPVRLEAQNVDSIEFVKNISTVSRAHRPLAETLASLLEKVCQYTRADRAALFSMDMRTAQVEMAASFHLTQEKVQPVKLKLPQSPVSDVIYRREHLFENDVPRHEGKYRNLLKVVEFNSCIGLPLEGIAGDLGYGLFLLGSRPHQFHEAELVKAEAAGAIIGRSIHEQWMIQQVATDQRLTLLGSLITSIGHELRGGVGALEVVGVLEKEWQAIKNHPELLAAPGAWSTMDEKLAQLAAAKRRMAELTDLILGNVRQNQIKLVDVNDCLRSAIAMVRYQASRARVVFDLQTGFIPKVKADALELEQVFQNVLLNAIQQMARSRRKGGRVTIQSQYVSDDPKYPIKLRFKDTGPGVHQKDLGKIFEPMFTTKSAGTGMGLFICRQLLGRMGAEIRVDETAILVGTTFVIEFPRV